MKRGDQCGTPDGRSRLRGDSACKSWGTTLVPPEKDCGIGWPAWQLVDWYEDYALLATQGPPHDIEVCSCVSPTSIETWSLPLVPGPLSPSIVSIGASLMAGRWGRRSIQLGGDFPSADRKGTPLWTH